MASFYHMWKIVIALAVAVRGAPHPRVQSQVVQTMVTAGCPAGCSGHGSCTTNQGTPVCRCDTPWVGLDCGKARCPNGCSGHGSCLQEKTAGLLPGDCLCEEGFTTKRDCSWSSCPNDCGGHGDCDHRTGSCACYHGFFGPSCDRRRCPNDCFDRGKCQSDGTCLCEGPWKGVDCSRAKCPGTPSLGECSGRGNCEQAGSTAGRCSCPFPWGGPGCEIAECPGDCSGHGECSQSPERRAGTCKCEEGWAKAEDCSIQENTCPSGCSNHGICKKGSCSCADGWRGDACSKALCPDGCTDVDHGTCDTRTGRCQCKAPFVGPACKNAACPSDCSLHGTCSPDGACICDDGYLGNACDLYACGDESTDWKCLNGGECNNTTGVCVCSPDWSGKDCSSEVASLTASPSVSASASPTPAESLSPTGTPSESASPSNTPSYSSSESPTESPTMSLTASSSTSISASASVHCPKGCSNHGVCTAEGSCDCDEGWQDEACDVPICVPSSDTSSTTEPCFGKGMCVAPGLCVCDDGFEAPLCQHAVCPYDCNGHGECSDELVCKCEEGWSNSEDVQGPGCTIKECPSDGQEECSGHGNCLDGKCKCQRSVETIMGMEHQTTWTGLDCATPQCMYNCSGRGTCVYFPGVGSKCNCDVGYAGEYCIDRVYLKPSPLPSPTCPQNADGQACFGHGDCIEGKCTCANGWEGYDCNDKSCNSTDCSGHGTCDHTSGTCFCDNPWWGPSCDQKSCPGTDHNCSGNGLCSVEGKCECAVGWKEPDCAKATCLDDCGNNGKCVGPLRCECGDGWTGESCANPVCLNNCSGHGACEAPYKCTCEPGYIGNACNETQHCFNNCSWPLGSCTLDGTCECREGWLSADCSVEDDRPCTSVEGGGCNGRGSCSCSGDCICIAGFSGRRCQHPAICAEGCSGKGQCVAKDSGTAKCVCFDGFMGVKCELEVATHHLVLLAGGTECPEDCNGQGICENGVCNCFVGYTGAECTDIQEVECPNGCSNHGLCEIPDVDGATTPVCGCTDGWTGEACDQPSNDCPSNCSCHASRCDKGSCVCTAGWSGKDCSIKPSKDMEAKCFDDCNGQGTCEEGRCMCDEDHYGRACEYKFCPLNCSNHFGNATAPHGTCDRLDGVCNCKTGFGGDGCEQVMCPKDSTCSGNGECNFKTGRCLCKPGFVGKACECADNPKCRIWGHGTVTCDGGCACEEPWIGEFCQKVPCMNFKGEVSECSGHGTCWPQDVQYVLNDGVTVMTVDQAKGTSKTVAASPEATSPGANTIGFYSGTCQCKHGWYTLDCSRKR